MSSSKPHAETEANEELTTDYTVRIKEELTRAKAQSTQRIDKNRNDPRETPRTLVPVGCQALKYLTLASLAS